MNDQKDSYIICICNTHYLFTIFQHDQSTDRLAIHFRSSLHFYFISICSNFLFKLKSSPCSSLEAIFNKSRHIKKDARKSYKQIYKNWILAFWCQWKQNCCKFLKIYYIHYSIFAYWIKWAYISLLWLLRNECSVFGVDAEQVILQKTNYIARP